MERAWRRRPPVLLIHGLGGVGKTTLALQFVQWLRDTGGLPPGHHFFIPFQDIRSADTVINTIGSAVFGPDFIAHPLDARIEALAKALRENPFALVWDNFESAFGNPDFGQQPNLNDEDRAALLAFLEKLRGGRTKILLTSRGEEDAWLPQTLRFKIPLGGLRGEERWELCTEILRDLGQTPDREDPEFKALIDWLGGHPLLMRATLPRLESLSPSQLLDELKASLDALDVSGTQSEEVKKAHAALHAVEQSLAPELRPLLIPLGLHERYVDADYLEEMANMVGDEAPDRAAIDRLFAALTTAGLTHHLGHSIYGIHPLLTSQLRVQPMEDSGISQAAEPREVSPENYAWTRAFIEFMANYANHVAPKEHHEQRFAFTVHGTNFNHAHLLAESDATFDQLILLTNSLASFARKTHRYADAERLFDRLVSLCSQAGNHNGLAVAYFQLGTVAEDCGDFEAAEKWFRKSLAISEEYPSGYDAGKTYTRLGSIADERHDFDAAETWHRKSLAIYKKSGNEEGIATTYHYLGIVAQKRDDFEGAAKWYVKALEINERLGRDDDTAANCQHLGIAAQLGQNFEDAEQWYLKSIKIKIKLQNEEGLAKTYGQMGNLSLDRQNLEDAEVWYLKSLAITEKLNNKSVNAITFYQLGLVAKQRGDFDAAEKWFRKALPIFERLADSHTAEIVKRNLSRLAEEDRSQPTNREKLSDLRAEPDRTNAAPDPDAPSP
ncbi:MAG: tetratricopeptide repeat protein [Planctomycetota bacterium]